MSYTQTKPDFMFYNANDKSLLIFEYFILFYTASWAYKNVNRSNNIYQPFHVYYIHSVALYSYVCVYTNVAINIIYTSFSVTEKKIVYLDNVVCNFIQDTLYIVTLGNLKWYWSKINTTKHIYDKNERKMKKKEKEKKAKQKSSKTQFLF